MEERTTSLSIILPCYNEAKTIPLLLSAYKEVWEDLPAELLLVDNGSTDDTREVISKEFSSGAFPFAKVVHVPKNMGYGHGIFQGLKAAKGVFMGFSHADMQCSPKDLFVAYKELIKEKPGTAMVKGRRIHRSSLLTGGMSMLASTVLLTPLTDINAQPKLFHRSLMEQMSNPPPGFEFDLFVLYRARKSGVKILTIPVEFGERAHGQSRWAFNIFSRYRTIWTVIKYIFKLRFGAA